jgi:hypothetical protein
MQEALMGAVMIKCPATGMAIPTGLSADGQSFARTPVFFARARCPLCHIEHEWFARDAWVQEAVLERAGSAEPRPDLRCEAA